MVEEKSELRSGITAPFNKRLNEALQFNPQMPFNIENSVTPSQLIGILKGEQGTPGLPAAISAVKDDNNLIMLAVSPIERGILKISQSTVTFTGAATFTITETVPVNKKWILKGYTFDITGTATLTYSANYEINSIGITIYAGSTATSNLSMINNSLILPPGTKFNVNYIVSANTNGVGRLRLLYQELDI